MDVVVVNPDGAVGPKGKTGPDGVLVLEGVFEGSLVSALYPVDNNEHVYASYAGIMPGDSLKFGDSYFVPEKAGMAGAHTITFDSYPGADTYLVETSCDSSDLATTTQVLSLYDYCQAATTPVVLRARDNLSQLIATKYVASVDATANSSSTISGWNAAP